MESVLKHFGEKKTRLPTIKEIPPKPKIKEETTYSSLHNPPSLQQSYSTGNLKAKQTPQKAFDTFGSRNKQTSKQRSSQIQ
jgi:hypothetical protein